MNPTVYTSNQLIITVDSNLSFEQMIALGQYECNHEYINAYWFPIKIGEGKKKITVEIIGYKDNVSKDMVLTDLNAKGLRPATYEELLAFGVGFSELRGFHVVALGSPVNINGHRRMVYIHSNDLERYLDLGWFDSGWDPDHRFLSVYK